MGQLEQALRIKPDLVEAQDNLAWLLATLPLSQGGDPVRAVRLAHRACELTGYRVAAHLNTLATAYAAAGQFTDAVDTAQEAIDLARSDGQLRLVSEIGARLQSYRDRIVSRQPADTPSPSSP
jgi:spermidine synthase